MRPVDSLMPYTSLSGTPNPRKKSKTSTAIGAAPLTATMQASSPSRARTAPSPASASAQAAARSGGSSSERARWSDTLSPTCSAASSCAFRAGSALAIAITPAWIFSHTRGTAKNTCGRTCGRYCATLPGSGQVVTS
jgi:hypothetical protein